MYSQLTQEERYQIYAYKQSGLTQKAIATELGRSASTISRELSRNKGKKGYRPKQAHEKAQARWKGVIRAIKLDNAMQSVMIEYLEQQWSPEQIKGYCHRHGIYRSPLKLQKKVA